MTGRHEPNQIAGGRKNGDHDGSSGGRDGSGTEEGERDFRGERNREK